MAQFSNHRAAVPGPSSGHRGHPTATGIPPSVTTQRATLGSFQMHENVDTEERQVARRLPKEARRAQLLDVAYEIIVDEGTDALTLARLAERAGVSKPIAYDHFATRAGLLAALFRHFDEQQIERMRAALAEGGDSLETTTRIAAAGYMDCLLSSGPEYEEICAALLAYEETKDFLTESRDRFIEEYRRVFSPFVGLDGAQGRGILTGLVGSAEALARDAHNGVLDADAATATLADIMLATLTPLASAKRPASTKNRAPTRRSRR